jgi:hypothetical protein
MGCRRVDLCVQMVRGTDLKILGLVGSDAGVYQCLATSPAGSIQAAAQLRVKSKGEKKTFSDKVYGTVCMAPSLGPVTDNCAPSF